MPALEVIRYGPSQFGPNFPQAGFFAEPTTLRSTRSQELKVLSLHWHHNPALVSVDNEPTELLRSLSFPQSSLDLLPVTHRCLLD